MTSGTNRGASLRRIGGGRGNADVFPLFKRRAKTAPVTLIEIAGGTHFTVLGPGCAVVARAILADSGPAPALQINADAINREMQTSAATHARRKIDRVR